ncbi:uncharacterized protein LOC115243835 [Formica exsecta]|uniref:uncharacterized protein LOC115243835 n=1 Tax=Formica exsecta TaxID=72781 RepID=UPI001144D1C0|nr:uncharacterized protein LOC115243835 [Formica exsecta]
MLLATARVRVADKFGVLHAVRALVDQGSEISLVAESLAQRLQLVRAPTSIAIVGVGGRSTGARGQVELALSPLRDGPPLRVSAFILDRLTTTSGGLRADRHSWRHLDNLELADLDFFAADPVELLLGADVCADILQPGAVRALVDQGSEISLVAESLAQRLQLVRAPTSIAIVGVGGRSTGARGQVELALSPLRDGPPLRILAFILDRLTTTSGGLRADRHSWRHLDNLELADPDFFAADPVELFLGADVCADILQPGLRRGGRQQPVAQRTTLGWILSGAVGVATAARTARTYHCRGDDDLHSLLQHFWKQEEVDATAAPLTAAEKEAEEHFAQTHSRDASGLFVVRLPLTPPLPDLTGTKFAAARLLEQMERRFTRDEQLRRLYSAFMQEYEDLGHMSPARPGTVMPSECFLPHHGVMRKASSSAKIRVVFNGSSTVASGACLNQHLKVGPNLLPALDDVLLRWRVHRFVLASDIKKMYRQILVAPEDRHLQKILWRHGDKTTPKEYELNTVTYGLACAPFLAIRSLRQLASDEDAFFPHGSAVLRRDVYVDDILTGAPTIEEAMDLQRQLTELCTAGGFPLRKWSANDPRLLDHIPAEHRTHKGRAKSADRQSKGILQRRSAKVRGETQ